MAYIIRCGTPLPNEVKALHEIEYVLQNDHEWVVVTNSGAHDPETNETDLLLIGKSGVVVVELKYWRGRVTSNLNAPWTVHFDDGTYELRSNPLEQGRRAALNIKNLFVNFGIHAKDFYVTYLIVMTHPKCQLVASSPKVASLAVSCSKFRLGLSDHVRVHQRKDNERSYGPDHIRRMLHALEIDGIDIDRAVDYLFNKQTFVRKSPNAPTPFREQPHLTEHAHIAPSTVSPSKKADTSYAANPKSDNFGNLSRIAEAPEVFTPHEENIEPVLNVSVVQSDGSNAQHATSSQVKTEQINTNKIENHSNCASRRSSFSEAHHDQSKLNISVRHDTTITDEFQKPSRKILCVRNKDLALKRIEELAEERRRFVEEVVNSNSQQSNKFDDVTLDVISPYNNPHFGPHVRTVIGLVPRSQGALIMREKLKSRSKDLPHHQFLKLNGMIIDDLPKVIEIYNDFFIKNPISLKDFYN